MCKQFVLIVLLIKFSCLYAFETTLKLYRPFGKVDEQMPLTVKALYKGHCFAQSYRIAREDAWRCKSKGLILDPCFVNLYGNQRQAICPLSPWNGESIALTLLNPLSNSMHEKLDFSKTYPWALELMNGEQCQALDKGSLVDNLPIYYQCASQTLLIGPLQRCKAVWSMMQYTKQNKLLKKVLVKKAWF